MQFQHTAHCVIFDNFLQLTLELVLTLFTINMGTVMKKLMLKKNFIFRQQLLDTILLNLQMGSIKKINIKNQTYYFFDDIIDIKNFDPVLLKIDKKSYEDIDIYYIGYTTVKDSDYVKINSVNPLYLIINEVDGYFEEINENRYLILVSTYKNKEALK